MVKMTIVLEIGAFLAVSFFAVSYCNHRQPITWKGIQPKTSVKNVNNEIRVLATISDVDIKGCIDNCQRRGVCHYINYHSSAHVCFLIEQLSVNITEENMVNDTSIVFGQRSEWIVEYGKQNYSACRNCSEGQLCTIQDGGLIDCTFNECPAPPVIADTQILGNRYTIGSRLRYRCNTTRKSYGIVCQSNGTWSAVDFTCSNSTESNDCSLPSSLTNGNFVPTGITHGSTVTYSCNSGYKLMGNQLSTCKDGNWDKPDPICMPDCGPITYPNINIDSIDDTTIGSTALVSCKPGYQLRYSTLPVAVVCSNDGIGGVYWKAMTEEPECWELMFRGTEDSGYSAANAYMYGSTGVRYELYNNGNVEMSLVMNGTGTTYTDWLFYNATGPWRSLEYPWTDMNETSESWWALNDWDGDVSTGHGRTFRIIKNYGECPVDTYYTVVLFEPNYGCNYENHLSWPKFLYTTTNTSSTFESEEYGMASVMAVWVYHD